jgi:hypothetical protein
MLCRRCGGLMIAEPFYDDVQILTRTEEESLGTRCINCGNVEDAVIQMNRLAPRSVRRTARHNLGVEVGTSFRERNTLVCDQTT